MTETTFLPAQSESAPTKWSNAATAAAILGWSMFFIVPALFIAALSQGIKGGPDDNSTSIIVIMLVFAAISFVSAVIGVIWGRTFTRAACIALVCCQAYPLVARNGFLF